MVPIKYASMSGKVVLGEYNPSNPNIPRPVTPSQVISEASVGLSSSTGTSTDANGDYEFTDLYLNYNNADRMIGNVVVNRSGF